MYWEAALPIILTVGVWKSIEHGQRRWLWLALAGGLIVIEAIILSASRAALVGAGLMAASGTARAYSVLTHQAVIDTVWKDGLEPAIRARFPRASEADLRRARAYAYGGCIVQDMGYITVGDKIDPNDWKNDPRPSPQEITDSVMDQLPPCPASERCGNLTMSGT